MGKKRVRQSSDAIEAQEVVSEEAFKARYEELVRVASAKGAADASAVNEKLKEFMKVVGDSGFSEESKARLRYLKGLHLIREGKFEAAFVLLAKVENFEAAYRSISPSLRLSIGGITIVHKQYTKKLKRKETIPSSLAMMYLYVAMKAYNPGGVALSKEKRHGSEFCRKDLLPLLVGLTGAGAADAGATEANSIVARASYLLMLDPASFNLFSSATVTAFSEEMFVPFFAKFELMLKYTDFIKHMPRHLSLSSLNGLYAALSAHKIENPLAVCVELIESTMTTSKTDEVLERDYGSLEFVLKHFGEIASQSTDLSPSLLKRLIRYAALRSEESARSEEPTTDYLTKLLSSIAYNGQLLTKFEQSDLMTLMSESLMTRKALLANASFCREMLELEDGSRDISLLFRLLADAELTRSLGEESPALRFKLRVLSQFVMNEDARVAMQKFLSEVLAGRYTEECAIASYCCAIMDPEKPADAIVESVCSVENKELRGILTVDLLSRSSELRKLSDDQIHVLLDGLDVLELKALLIKLSSDSGAFYRVLILVEKPENLLGIANELSEANLLIMLYVLYLKAADHNNRLLLVTQLQIRAENLKASGLQFLLKKVQTGGYAKIQPFLNPRVILALSTKDFSALLNQVPTQLRNRIFSDLQQQWFGGGSSSLLGDVTVAEREKLAGWLLRYPAYLAQASHEDVGALCEVLKERRELNGESTLAGIIIGLNKAKQFDACQVVLRVILASGEALFSEAAIQELSTCFGPKMLAVLAVYCPECMTEEMWERLSPAFKTFRDAVAAAKVDGCALCASTTWFTTNVVLGPFSQQQFNAVLDTLPDRTRIDVLFGLRDLSIPYNSDVAQHAAGLLVTYIVRNLSAIRGSGSSILSAEGLVSLFRKRTAFSLEFGSEVTSVLDMTRCSSDGAVVEPLLNEELAMVAVSVLPAVLSNLETEDSEDRQLFSESVGNLSVLIEDEGETEGAVGRNARSFLLERAKEFKQQLKEVQGEIKEKKTKILEKQREITKRKRDLQAQEQKREQEKSGSVAEQGELIHQAMEVGSVDSLTEEIRVDEAAILDMEAGVAQLEKLVAVLPEATREMLTQSVLSAREVTSELETKLKRVDADFLKRFSSGEKLSSAADVSAFCLLSKFAPEFVAVSSLLELIALLTTLKTEEKSPNALIIESLLAKDTTYDCWLNEAEAKAKTKTKAESSELFIGLVAELIKLVGAQELYTIVRSLNNSKVYAAMVDSRICALLLVQLLADKAFVAAMTKSQASLATYLELLTINLTGYSRKKDFALQGEFIARLIQYVTKVKNEESRAMVCQAILLDVMLQGSITAEHVGLLVEALDESTTFSIVNSSFDELANAAKRHLLLSALRNDDCLIGVHDVSQLARRLLQYVSVDECAKEVSASIAKLSSAQAGKSDAFAFALILERALFDNLSDAVKTKCIRWLTADSVISLIEKYSEDEAFETLVAKALGAKQKERLLEKLDELGENFEESPLFRFVRANVQVFFQSVGVAQLLLRMRGPKKLGLRLAQTLRLVDKEEVSDAASRIAFELALELRDAKEICDTLRSSKRIVGLSDEKLVAALSHAIKFNLEVDLNGLLQGLKEREERAEGMGKRENAAIMSMMMMMFGASGLERNASSLFSALMAYWMGFDRRYKPDTMDVLRLFDTTKSSRYRGEIANALVSSTYYRDSILVFVQSGRYDESTARQLANAFNATSKSLGGLLSVTKAGGKNLWIIDCLMHPSVFSLLSKEKQAQLRGVEASYFDGNYVYLSTTRRIAHKARRRFERFVQRVVPTGSKKMLKAGGVVGVPGLEKLFVDESTSVVVILDRLSRYGITCEPERTIDLDNVSVSKEAHDEILVLLNALCAYYKVNGASESESVQPVFACLVHDLLVNLSGVRFDDVSLSDSMTKLETRLGSQCSSCSR